MNWYVKLFDVCIHREYIFIFIQIILAAISGDNGDIKQQKWSFLAEHVANKHDSCVHGGLDGERQCLREGTTFKIIKINLYT